MLNGKQQSGCDRGQLKKINECQFIGTSLKIGSVLDVGKSGVLPLQILSKPTYAKRTLYDQKKDMKILDRPGGLLRMICGPLGIVLGHYKCGLYT